MAKKKKEKKTLILMDSEILEKILSYESVEQKRSQRSFSLRLPRDLLPRLNEVRRNLEVIPSVSALIYQMVEASLATGGF